MRFFLAVAIVASGVVLAKLLNFEPLALPLLVMATVVLYTEAS